MMFIGHDSDRYGYLSVNGKAMHPGSIAQRCGCTLEQYLTLLAELDEFGVPSRTPHGIIYSRRMVRDQDKRELSSKRQRKFKKKKKVSNASITQQKQSSNGDNEDENENEKEVVVSKRKANYEDVLAYCVQIQLVESDAQWVFDKWQGCGWKNDGRQILDWKATLRSWKRISIFPSQRDGNGKSRVAQGKSIDELGKEMMANAGKR